MMTTPAFTKIVRIGTVDEYPRPADLFCKISFGGSRLSITGVIGPKHSGDCAGSFGQVVMSDWLMATYAPGWDADTVAQFRSIWKAWHLNDMQAGSPAQTAHLKAHPVTDRTDPFGKACESLKAAGLQPDPSFAHNGKPYSYGSTWLSVDVPEDALQFLQSLPDADKAPAWV